MIGPDIEVVVLGTEAGQVRLGIRAPRHVAVLRRELVSQVVDENRRAAAVPVPAAALAGLRRPPTPAPTKPRPTPRPLPTG
jgi:carbon storage regulator